MPACLRQKLFYVRACYHWLSSVLCEERMCSTMPATGSISSPPLQYPIPPGGEAQIKKKKTEFWFTSGLEGKTKGSA